MTLINQQFLHSLWGQLQTAILLLDSQFVVRYANTSCSELLGLGEKRLYQHDFSQLFHHHTISLEQLKHYTLQDGVDFHQHQADVTFVDARHASLAVYCRRVTYQQQHYVLIELRQIDQAMRDNHASLQLQQYQAARTLINNLAHEIKNPLGGIRGAAQLLQMETDAQERHECAELIIAQADRLSVLVDKLLGPNQKLQKQQCNIHQTLERVLTLCQLENSKQLSFIKDYDPSIPTVFIDPDKIEQVLLNIVRNAMQACDEQGEITLKTRIKHHVRHIEKPLKKALEITIIDNGSGIDPTIRDTLFYPTVTNKKTGSGLGLSIAKTLMEQHQGGIACDSWQGYTEFTLYLPLNTEPPQKSHP